MYRVQEGTFTGDGGENGEEEVTGYPSAVSTALYHSNLGNYYSQLGSSSSSSSSSGSTSLTYWEEKYGVEEGSTASGAPLSVDFSAFSPSFTETDRALALFRLILSFFFVTLGIYALVRFYRSRWILDIRTRSVRLVIIGGATVTISYLVVINESLRIMYGPDHSLPWFWSSLVLFFLTPGLFGSYICRAIRLAVVFHPRAKRSLPWLIPERNHLCFLLLVSFGFLAIPIHDEYTSSVYPWEVIQKQTKLLTAIVITFGVILACLYPFIRRVDDLFNISTELIVVTVLLIIYAVGQMAVWQYGGEEEMRWIGKFLPFFISAAVFGVSVVDPLVRLALDPMVASKQINANRVLLNVNEYRVMEQTTSSGGSSRIGPESEDEGMRSERTEAKVGRLPNVARGAAVDRFFSIQRRVGEGSEGGEAAGEVWDFERLASTPLLAAAFEDYARRALCHESVLFLTDVARYREGNYLDAFGVSSPSQYDTFCRITDTFIKAGSREEVNIGDADKKRLVNLAKKGREWFEQMEREERRLVFTQAYTEIKGMLDADLVFRFLQTDQFKSVRAQRENVTAMMVSPC